MTLVPARASTTWLGEYQGLDITDDIVRTINLVKILEPSWEGNQVALQRFETFATRCYTARINALSLLPSLAQFHFVKALFANMEVLGLSDDEMDDEALSPFNSLLGPFPVQPQHTVARFSKLPTALRPTDRQSATPHHPWIDLLPIPRMRDNIFRQREELFDEEALCHAMRGQAPDFAPGLLAWRDPWDPTGWEVTEEFCRDWGWVVEGCVDLLRSTNVWRAQRGDKPLVIEVSRPGESNFHPNIIE